MHKLISISAVNGKRSLEGEYGADEYNIKDVQNFYLIGIQHFLEKCTQNSKKDWVVWFFDPDRISLETQKPIYLKICIEHLMKYDSDILSKMDAETKNSLKISLIAGHFYFTVYECLTAEDNPQTNTQILSFRLSESTDGSSTVCELQHLNKGTVISGSEGLDYLTFFKRAFGVTQTVLADASIQNRAYTLNFSCEEASATKEVKISYSLKFYHALLKGQGWYESKGYRAITCKSVKDFMGNPLHQHPLLYQLAIQKIQNTSVQTLWVFHQQEQKLALLNLIDGVFPNFQVNNSLSVKDFLVELDKTRNSLKSQGRILSFLELLTIKSATGVFSEEIKLHNLAITTIHNTVVFLSQRPVLEYPQTTESFDSFARRCLGGKTVPGTYAGLMKAVFCSEKG